MQRFITPYRGFLAITDVRGMVVSAFLARMPIGMIGLAMLLFLRESLGSFTLAGSAVGTFFVAMAAMAPMVGRLIDRHGPMRLLWCTGPVQPLLLAALAWCALGGAAPVWVFVMAALAGCFQPPITVLTRTVWRYRFDDEPTRKLAFAVDSVMIELNFTLGPALVAGLLALFGAAHAYLITIGVVVLAFVAFMSSPILTYWQHDPHAERHLLGPLTDGKLLLLFATSFGLTFCFGLLEVGYPGYATLLGASAFGGVLLAINSLGSATGGAIYGALHFKLSMERQYAVALALMALPLFLHASVVALPWVFAAVAFLAGMLIAPALTAQTILVARLAPAKYATEAFTWSSTFIVSGIGVGLATGGALIEAAGIAATFTLGGVVLLAMALLAMGLPRPAT